MESNIILSMVDVFKSFGSTKALKGVQLNVLEGEVHAIVGSNGAGKSTLMKTLAGVHKPDAGNVYFDGEDITGLVPLEVQSKGIEVVHQVLNIVDSMSVLENVLLAHPPMKKGFLSFSDKEEQVKEVLKSVGSTVDINTPAGQLSASEQQFVLLARAIIQNPKVLVLDEPSSRIGLEETEKLFDVVRGLKKQGTSIIYISHRMEEIYEICDRISVYRDGQYVETRNSKDFPENELVASMLGKSMETFYPKLDNPIGDSVLKVNNLTYGEKVRDVSFEVKKGEIVSLVGAVGAGKTEILNSIYGIITPDAGEYYVSDTEVPLKHSPSFSTKMGIALVPEDRALQGMINNYSIKQNLTSINMKNVVKKGLLNSDLEDEISQSLNNKLGVEPNDINYVIGDLSGGNQQKVVIGKWLTDPYSIYLLDEVTAGVDVGAKSEIYKLLGELASEEAGILLATGDLEEALGISDRIIVIYKGQVIKEVVPSEITKHELLTYIMGSDVNE